MAWDINKDEVTMTNSANTQTYVLHASTYVNPLTGDSSQGYSCIDSYKIYGGPQQPFEYIVLKISKKRLTSLAPMLVDDIRAGLNVITVYGFGMKGQKYIVTSCKTTSSSWKITAYSVSEQIRGYTSTSTIAMGAGDNPPSNATLLRGTPASVIAAVVEPSSQHTFMALNESTLPIESVVMAYRKNENSFNGYMTFQPGTSVWYILSLCAMRLGCNMWVSEGILYVIDLSLSQAELQNSTICGRYASARDGLEPWTFKERSTVFLNTEGIYPYNPTVDQKDILNNVLGTPDPGQEGRNLVKNKVVITINPDKDNTVPSSGLEMNGEVVITKGSVISGMHVLSAVNPQTGVTYYYVSDARNSLGECKKSQEKYGVIQGDYTFKEADRGFAQSIADLLVKMYCDSEQPITFTMRETTVERSQNGRIVGVYWQEAFDNTTRIDRIVDYSNDIAVSIASNLSPDDSSKNRPAKGMISRWIRNFPEHTTTYTFGEIAPTDMTQNNSVIHTAIGSGGM